MSTATQARIEIREVEVHLFAADASELCFPPGQWPKRVATDAGNGQPFERTRAIYHEDGSGDLACVEYTQALGCIRLRVYND